MIKLIIFDFDGTIADTKNLWYFSIKKVMKKYGVNFTREHLKETLGLKMREIAERRGIRDKGSLKNISDSVHEYVFLNSKKIKIGLGIRDAEELKVRKIIISNSDGNKIRKVLGRDKIDFFDEIHGGDEFANKAEFIKDYLRDEGLNGTEVIYLGDMGRDVSVARDVGCISAVIIHKMSWSTGEELIRAEPDFIITKFADLKGIIKSLE